MFYYFQEVTKNVDFAFFSFTILLKKEVDNE